jgi:hypothetical protein
LSGSHDLNNQLTALDNAVEFAEAELIKVWRTLAETDYGHFYEFMNRDEGYELSRHQRLIADLLMRAEAGELMRGMVSMPPGHCKSTHCSHHFPAWYFGRNPRRRFLQAGRRQAKHFGLNFMMNHTCSSSKGRWNPRVSTAFIRERLSTSKVR